MGAALLLLVSACGGSDEPLDGTTWEPTDLGGVPVVEGSEPFVTFGADALMNGSTGCNGFSGGWSAEGGDGGIEIITGAMTQSVCATDELQAQETAFLAGLNVALFYERDGDKLTLLNGEKTELITLGEIDTPE